MIEPTTEQRALLRGFERLSFWLCEAVNRDGPLKRVSHLFLRQVGARWVELCTRKLLQIDGLSEVEKLQPPAGLLVVANHRTFFDQYVISQILMNRTRLLDRVYFPVRSEFFYDQPLGFFLNGIMSGWSMFPPVLRQPERSGFNRYTMERLRELLEQRGVMVGFHPEGTRNKTEDPYTLLPAQPGVGQLIIQARPTVLPVFIHGMTNDVVRQVRSNFDGTGEKIIVVFGAPLDLHRFYGMPARLRTYMEVARFVREEITRLGARERELRRGSAEGHPEAKRSAESQ